MLDRTIAPGFARTNSFELAKPDIHNLPNGLRAYFIGGGAQDVLKIEFVFEAGTWYETKTATAYFTTQLLSKGTAAKNSFEIAHIFDQYGAHLDVSPGLDFVSISVYTLRKNLTVILQLLMEILSTPAFPESEFSQAKSMFVQNLQVNNEKTSYVASKQFRKNLFGERHPYGMIVEEKDPNQLVIADFRHFFETHFTLPHVYVSGKITKSDKAEILEHLSLHRSGKHAIAPSYDAHEGPAYEHVDKKDSVQSSIRIGKRSISRSHPDYVSILLANHILGGYFGSRLMKNIREEKGLTYGISASIHGMKRDSFLIIGADVNQENTELTFEEISKELKRLRSELITADELETARNHFIGSLQSEITTPFAHADKIKTITLHNLKWGHYQDIIKKIDAMTPSEISRVGEQYFHEDSFTRVAVG